MAVLGGENGALANLGFSFAWERGAVSLMAVCGETATATDTDRHRR